MILRLFKEIGWNELFFVWYIIFVLMIFFWLVGMIMLSGIVMVSGVLVCDFFFMGGRGKVVLLMSIEFWRLVLRNGLMMRNDLLLLIKWKLFWFFGRGIGFFLVSCLYDVWFRFRFKLRIILYVMLFEFLFIIMIVCVSFLFLSMVIVFVMFSMLDRLNWKMVLFYFSSWIDIFEGFCLNWRLNFGILFWM